MTDEKHICNEKTKFICGKNNCNFICCPECIIEHYSKCCFPNEICKNIMPKKLVKDEEEFEEKRGHPYYNYNS